MYGQHQGLQTSTWGNNIVLPVVLFQFTRSTAYLTSMTSSIAAPITSLVICIRLLCSSNSIIIPLIPERFMLVLIWRIACNGTFWCWVFVILTCKEGIILEVNLSTRHVDLVQIDLGTTNNTQAINLVDHLRQVATRSGHCVCCAWMC